MRFSSQLWVSVTLLLSSLVCSAPLDSEVPLRQLTQADFNSSMATGLWLIEFFSPYCIHCRQFEPTWRALVEEKTSVVPGFALAQVDCMAQGDICDEQHIDGYPKILLFHKGERVDTFAGSRTLPRLIDFAHDGISKYLSINDVLPPPVTPTAPRVSKNLQQALIPRTPPNALGEVKVLNGISAFDAALAEGPLFVKMYAPWCGHCKKLAPVWKDLAKNMQGTLNVAEVDCDSNADICRREAVEGYPMLFFYQNGHRLDYRGPRKLADLEPYARKAVAASVGLQELDIDKFHQVIMDEPAFFLFLYDSASGYSEAATELVRKAAFRHAGSAPIYYSTAPSLVDEFSVAKEPVLISVKDHTRQAAACFYLASAVEASKVLEHSNDLDRFISIHRFPSAFELTSTNFPEVMRSSTSNLVVLVPIEPDAFDINGEIEATLTRVHKAWNTRLNTPNGATLPVLFVWVDSQRWSDWLQDTYGYKHDASAEPRAILTDHKRLTYYDGPKDRPISVAEHSIIATLDAYARGTVQLKYSENWFARKVRAMHDSIENLALGFVHHPVRTVLIIVIALVLLFAGLERCFREPPRHHHLHRQHQSRPREKLSLKRRRLD